MSLLARGIDHRHRLGSTHPGPPDDQVPRDFEDRYGVPVPGDSLTYLDRADGDRRGTGTLTGLEGAALP